MLTYRIGMIGNPVNPLVEWTAENMTEMKAMGFNAMQLNVAWGCRPGNEPLNLEDVILRPGMDAARTAEVTELRGRVRNRLAKCKEYGMRAIFHFGAPFNGRTAYDGMPLGQCISDHEVTGKYVGLLRELEIQIPGIDELLLYTYDQDAWLCSEFVNCDTCRGVPLHERVPAFVTALCDAWREIRPDGRFWWEPWELSAGQALRIVQELPTENFGLMLHSNTGEVQKTRPVDLWFRNMAMLAKECGIPVVGECFLAEASEETEPLLRVPCPQLTYTQIHAVAEVAGVHGVKEYYGLLPGRQDPCLRMAGLVLNDMSLSLEECLERLAEPYQACAEDVLELWRLVYEGYMLYPADTSWFAREIGKANPNHGWQAAFLRGQQASTPSWESSRHAIFMKTDDRQPHPWMLEDVQLRCQLAGERMGRAADLCQDILNRLSGEQKAQFVETMDSLRYYSRVCVSYTLHLRMTNVAALLREDKAAGRPLSSRLMEELHEILESDARNQNDAGRILEIRQDFERDPLRWLDTWLLCSDEDVKECGEFSLTTR